MAATAGKMSLKLLIDKKSKKVLFAESGKEFVDFLFNLLNLPVATVILLLTTGGMVGSFGNIYKSVENLNDTYMQPNKDKQSLLRPALMCPSTVAHHLLTNSDAFSTPKLYTCPNLHGYVSSDPTAKCPHLVGYTQKCDKLMSSALSYVDAKKGGGENNGGGEGGYVKGVVTYTITDDLVVAPMSTITCVSLLNIAGVHDIGALEERVVQIGLDEGLKLLREAMMSKMVLTNVFVRNQTAAAAAV
ncbi:unnamed protein product [Rhodiola kirilowii]